MTKKQILITTLISIAVAITYNIILNTYSDKQLQQEAAKYKQCIQQQSDTRGWIIRSECSSNYRILDEVAQIQYTQIGYDLYLTK